MQTITDPYDKLPYDKHNYTQTVGRLYKTQYNKVVNFFTKTGPY